MPKSTSVFSDAPPPFTLLVSVGSVRCRRTLEFCREARSRRRCAFSVCRVAIWERSGPSPPAMVTTRCACSRAFLERDVRQQQNRAASSSTTRPPQPAVTPMRPSSVSISWLAPSSSAGWRSRGAICCASGEEGGRRGESGGAWVDCFGGKLGLVDCLGGSCGGGDILGGSGGRGGGGATRLHVTVFVGHELPSVEKHVRTVPATDMHGPEPVVQPSQSPVPP